MAVRHQRSGKAHPFSELEIQERARAIWLARGGTGGSPEQDWQDAIQSLYAERSLPRRLREILSRRPLPYDLNLEINLRWLRLEWCKFWVTLAGLVATGSAAVGLYYNIQHNRETLISERFAKAIEQLDSKNQSVRIGGIYSLERLAKDSPRDHWTIMEVISAYLQQNATLSSFKRDPKLTGAPLDILAAVNVIRRRSPTAEPNPFNFSGLYLAKANLFRANLPGVDLSGSVLTQANLERAVLKEGNLVKAKLDQANLIGVDLEGGNLSQSNLTGAELAGVNLTGANLSESQLFNAKFGGAKVPFANFENAVLRGADLSHLRGQEVNFQQADLRNAVLWNVIIPSSNFSSAQLGFGLDVHSDYTEGDFDQAKLIAFYCEECNFTGAWFKQAKVLNSSFIRSNLQNADFRGANLTGTNLGAVRQVIVGGETLPSVSKLDGALFGGANLTRVEITKQQLDSVLLCQTRMPDGVTISNRDCKKYRDRKILLPGEPDWDFD